MTHEARCPKCNAELPRKGQFCIECGLDLYAEGIRRPSSPWLLMAVAAVVVAGVVGYFATRPGRSPETPEGEQVRALTKNVLDLVAREKYDEIARQFMKPDKQLYEEAGSLLWDIVKEKGALEMLKIRAICRDDPRELDTLIKKLRPQYPQYIARLVSAIAFEGGQLRGLFAATTKMECAESFLPWYLCQAFEGGAAEGAEVAELGWRDDPGGDRLLVATIRYPEPPKPIPGVADPAALPWRWLGEGQWALALGRHDLHLDELLRFIQRVKLE